MSNKILGPNWVRQYAVEHGRDPGLVGRPRKKPTKTTTAKHSVLDWAEGVAQAKLAGNDRVLVEA
jgi:hypothetical protein